MIEIIIKKSEEEISRFSFKRDIVKIGRAADNDIVIHDKDISRYHAEIRCEFGKYFIYDVNSKNGIYCNNIRIKEKQELLPKTKVKIGYHSLVFVGSKEEKDNISEIEIEEGSHTEFFPVDKLAEKVSDFKLEDEKEAKGFARAERVNKNLNILYNMGKALLKIQDIKEISELSIQNIKKIIKAERIIFQLKNINGELETLECKIPDGEQNIKLSKAITHKVLDEGVAILSSDALEDERFSESDSVFVQSIRSMMCVPIWNEKDFMGLIYMDNQQSLNSFEETELQIISAIANQAAISIDNIHLKENIKEEIKLRSNLERYHSPDVVDLILKNEGSLQIAEEKDVTILFSDIKGFTSLSEQNTAKEITKLLNEYFDRMTEVIFANKGTLDKFIGDAIMAIFGAPLSYQNDACNAVNAALDMLRIHKMWMMEKPKYLQFGIRIGINTGKVIAGNIGSKKRVDYTVLGDPVNIASRLESLANINSVFIGETTYSLVKDDFIFREVGPSMLKGKAKKVMVYEVTGRKKTSHTTLPAISIKSP